MLHKDMRRAERRWRSYSKFIRRLRGDQVQHGRRWSPRRIPVTLLNSPASDSPLRYTTLCTCFYCPKEQARFKDTPTGSYSRRKWRESEGWLSCSDERRLEAPEEHGKGRRDRRRGLIVRLHRACLRCGRSLGRIRHVVGEFDTAGMNVVCWECDYRDTRPIVWINGRLVGS